MRPVISSAVAILVSIFLFFLVWFLRRQSRYRNLARYLQHAQDSYQKQEYQQAFEYYMEIARLKHYKLLSDEDRSLLQVISDCHGHLDIVPDRWSHQQFFKVLEVNLPYIEDEGLRHTLVESVYRFSQKAVFSGRGMRLLSTLSQKYDKSELIHEKLVLLYFFYKDSQAVIGAIRRWRDCIASPSQSILFTVETLVRKSHEIAYRFELADLYYETNRQGKAAEIYLSLLRHYRHNMFLANRQKEVIVRVGCYLLSQPVTAMDSSKRKILLKFAEHVAQERVAETAERVVVKLIEMIEKFYTLSRRITIMERMYKIGLKTPSTLHYLAWLYVQRKTKRPKEEPILVESFKATKDKELGLYLVDCYLDWKQLKQWSNIIRVLQDIPQDQKSWNDLDYTLKFLQRGVFHPIYFPGTDCDFET